MIIMALDHIREFFHSGAMSFQADDLTRTTVPLFFTRWITHICAPVFMLTAGIAAFLWYQRGHTKAELSRFLWTRGLWLVILDLTIIRFALNFSLTSTSGFVILNVLWALGWSMVALALLVYIPVRWLASLSIAVIALHNLADPITAASFGSRGWIWNIIHQPGVFKVGDAVVLAAYPLIPWIAVMSLGFCLGRVFLWEPDARQRFLIRTGLVMIIAFLVIRAVNVYGDPAPWSWQTRLPTALSFLRTTKYPPSLDFLLMTLGPAMLLLAGFGRLRLGASHPFLVFGRVPLFFFIAHLYAIHLLTIPFALVRYGEAAFLRHPTPSLGGDPKLYPTGFGYDLWVTYCVWIAIIVLLYPLCLWFARLKERRRDWWLSYI